MMFRNLRSVFAKVHPQSKCVGSTRKFSGESTHNDTEISFPAWLFTRGVALSSGVGAGYYMYGGRASKFNEMQEKRLKESQENFKKREDIWSEIAASASKS